MKAYSNIYQKTAAKLAALIDSDPGIWSRGFKGISGQRNFATGAKFHGWNALICSMMMLQKGYELPLWGTFKQVQDMGGYVKRGESAVPGIFYKIYKKEVEKEDGSIEEKKVFVLKNVYYFNIDQCVFTDNVRDEIIDFYYIQKNKFSENKDAEDVATSYIEKYDVGLEHGFKYSPSYSIDFDTIFMPEKRQFNSENEYYATLFHEIAHSTGHEDRLNRVIKNKFGDPKYALEELVAEIAASFVCEICSIEHNINNSAAYLKSWLAALESEPKAFIQAVSAAQKAADMIIGASNDDGSDGGDGSNEDVAIAVKSKSEVSKVKAYGIKTTPPKTQDNSLAVGIFFPERADGVGVPSAEMIEKAEREKAAFSEVLAAFEAAFEAAKERIGGEGKSGESERLAKRARAIERWAKATEIKPKTLKSTGREWDKEYRLEKPIVEDNVSNAEKHLKKLIDNKAPKAAISAAKRVLEYWEKY